MGQCTYEITFFFFPKFHNLDIKDIKDEERQITKVSCLEDHTIHIENIVGNDRNIVEMILVQIMIAVERVVFPVIENPQVQWKFWLTPIINGMKYNEGKLN